ncbi:MAG: NERD domain-containing protein [archaeon]|nr:NERD domain-containing protein [archaeon]
MVSALDAEAFSSTLDWKQFEGLAELALRSFGYDTIKNYRLTKPRLEIDLVAISAKVAFGIDCKHWKRTVGQATMLAIAQKQIKRCKRLLENIGVETIVPVILTWHDEQLQVLENGVAVVPIQKISDFFLNWESTGVIKVIKKSELTERNC